MLGWRVPTCCGKLVGLLAGPPASLVLLMTSTATPLDGISANAAWQPGSPALLAMCVSTYVCACACMCVYSVPAQGKKVYTSLRYGAGMALYRNKMTATKSYICEYSPLSTKPNIPDIISSHQIPPGLIRHRSHMTS